MKIKLIIGVVALSLSTSAMAGVQEKKAKRELIEKTDKKLVKTQKACGSQTKVSFDFKKYEAFMNANAEKLKTKHFAYTYAERNTSAMLYDLQSLCSDPDYKAEISKLATINIMPNSSYDDRKSEFKLSADGKTLTAQLPTNPSVSSGYKSQIKAVW